MNTRIVPFIRLSLIALLLGSEWGIHAQFSEQLNIRAQHEHVPTVDSSTAFGLPCIALGSKAESRIGMEKSKPLPQDSGHLAAYARELNAAAKRNGGYIFLDGGKSSPEKTLFLQHTRLQI